MASERSTDVQAFIGELDGGVFETKIGAVLSEVASGVMNTKTKGKVSLNLEIEPFDENRVKIKHKLSYVRPRLRKTSGKMHFYFNSSSFNHYAGFCCFFIACGRSARLFNTQSAAFSASGVIGLPVRTSTFVPTLAAAAACISSNLSPTI